MRNMFWATISYKHHGSQDRAWVLQGFLSIKQKLEIQIDHFNLYLSIFCVLSKIKIYSTIFKLEKYKRWKLYRPHFVGSNTILRSYIQKHTGEEEEEKVADITLIFRLSVSQCHDNNKHIYIYMCIYISIYLYGTQHSIFKCS